MHHLRKGNEHFNQGTSLPGCCFIYSSLKEWNWKTGYVYMYIKGGLLHWLLQRSQGSSAMAVLHWTGPGSGSFSVLKIRCLGSPNSLEDSWRAALLQSVLESQRSWFLTSKRHCTSRADELASESKGKQAKSQISSFHVLSSGLPS